MTADEVRALLSYEAATGLLRWRVAPGGRARLGAIAGTRDRDGYVVVRYRGRGYKAHRLAWLHWHGVAPRGLIDHINHCRDDNRIANLRDVNAQVNADHLRPDARPTRSGVRGVSWFSQYRKWKATFTYRKRHYFVGHFDTVAAAEIALANARAKVKHYTIEDSDGQ